MRHGEIAMLRSLPRILLIAVLLIPMPLLAQLRFQEGRHYRQVAMPQATGLAPAGKIEVTEVFSYVCGGCNAYQAAVDQLKTALPADAALTFVHAGFQRGWDLFQRGHLTAQKLGVADRNHARLFTAIWQTAEFPFFDRATGQPRQPPPVVRDIARFYARGGGVTEADFAKTAMSPEITAAMARTDALVRGWQVPSTPALVVAGRYLINMDEMTSNEDVRALTSFLIGLERSRLKSATAPAATKG
jgi:protein dithiol oxidoreductase (disulfide-forming)